MAQMVKCDKCRDIKDRPLSYSLPEGWRQLDIKWRNGYSERTVEIDLCPDCIKALGWLGEQNQLSPPTTADELYNAIATIVQENTPN